MSRVPKEISQAGPLRGAPAVHDLLCKEEEPEEPEEPADPSEDPSEETCDECDEIFVVGEALGEEDFEYIDGDKDRAVRRRCYFFWGVFLLVLAVLLSQYYFDRLYTVY